MMWIRATVDEDGEVSPNRFGERIPDSPALPAVARWLAIDGNREALTDVIEYELVHGMLHERLRVRLRTLIAALEGAE